MTTVWAFMQGFCAVLDEVGVSPDSIIPGGLGAIQANPVANEIMPRAAIRGGYQKVAEYLRERTGEEIAWVYADSPEKELDGHQVAHTLMDVFEAWRSERKKRGLRENGFVHSISAAFITGMLGDDDSSGRPLTREEMVQLWLTASDIILSNQEMCDLYPAAINAHPGNTIFRDLLNGYVVAALCEDGEDLTLEGLRRAIGHAEMEFSLKHPAN